MPTPRLPQVFVGLQLPPQSPTQPQHQWGSCLAAPRSLGPLATSPWVTPHSPTPLVFATLLSVTKASVLGRLTPNAMPLWEPAPFTTTPQVATTLLLVQLRFGTTRPASSTQRSVRTLLSTTEPPSPTLQLEPSLFGTTLVVTTLALVFEACAQLQVARKTLALAFAPSSASLEVATLVWVLALYVWLSAVLTTWVWDTAPAT